MSTPAADREDGLRCGDCGSAVAVGTPRCPVCQASSRAGEAPGAIALAPGDDLADAVHALAEGGELTLEAGEYRLSRPLLVAKSLTIRGAGRDLTRVVSSAEGTAIRVAAPDRFACYGVSFEHVGDRWAHILVVAAGTVALKGCRFKDAHRNVEADDLGDGLRLEGEVVGLVERCEFVDNGSHGCRVRDRARPVFKDNDFCHNERSGLAYTDQAGGEATGNRAFGNGAHGVFVEGEATPTLVNNQLRENGRAGLSYFGTAAGTATGNTSEQNREGATAMDAAAPRLEENRLSHNREFGLHVGGGARAVVHHNTITGNGWDGVVVSQSASPTLEGNVLTANQRSGLVFLDGAGGRAASNRIEGNGAHGIEIRHQASPALTDNTIGGNRWSDLWREGPAVARRGSPIARLFGRLRPSDDLPRLIAEAPVGGTLRLEPVTYRLRDTLVLDKAITIMGAEDGATMIEGDAAGALLRYEGLGLIKLIGLSFKRAGASPADVVAIRSGEAEIARCRFSGGVHRGHGELGAGLALSCASAEVTGCTFLDNGGPGLLLNGDCHAKVVECTGTRNTGAGCSISVRECLIERSTWRNNQGHGLHFDRDSGGMVVANTCEGNGGHGVIVEAGAKPTLHHNVFSKNGGAGILFGGRNAGGSAYRNTCDANAGAGIEVGERARPVLEHNELAYNDGPGLAYRKRAAGKATGNRYGGNRGPGLLLEPGAQPVLTDNGSR